MLEHSFSSYIHCPESYGCWFNESLRMNELQRWQCFQIQRFRLLSARSQCWGIHFGINWKNTTEENTRQIEKNRTKMGEGSSIHWNGKDRTRFQREQISDPSSFEHSPIHPFIQWKGLDLKGWELVSLLLRFSLPLSTRLFLSVSFYPLLSLSLSIRFFLPLFSSKQQRIQHFFFGSFFMLRIEFVKQMMLKNRME